MQSHSHDVHVQALHNVHAISMSSIALADENNKCVECSSLDPTAVKNMELRIIRTTHDNAQETGNGVLPGETHKVGSQHSHPFEHTFFQFAGKGAIRRTAFNPNAHRRTFLCLHLDCMNFISPGCMYCETCKKTCTKCRTEPRANRSTKLCYTCLGRAPPTDDLKIESDLFKNVS